MASAVRTHRTILTALLLLSPIARAGGPHEGDPEAQADMERKGHLIRLVEIADALELGDEQVLKLKATLADFDRKWHPVHAELESNIEVVRRAARGDKEALSRVDAAIARMRALRNQIQQLDVELFQRLSQGQDARHRARLAVVMSRLPWELHDILHRGKELNPPQTSDSPSR